MVLKEMKNSTDSSENNNPIMDNAVFFRLFPLLVYIPLIIFFLTEHLNGRFKNLFQTKYVCLTGCFFIIVAFFSYLIFDVFSNIRSLSHVANNHFLFSSTFFAGLIALIAFITFVAIRKNKYTKFEHVFIVTYSLLSLYSSYFLLSRFGCNYNCLFAIIVIFLINVVIFILAIKYFRLMRHSSSLFRENMELFKIYNSYLKFSKLAGGLSEKIVSSGIPLDHQFEDRKHLLQSINEDFKIFGRLLFEFEESFHYSFLNSFMKKGFHIISWNPNDIFIEIENLQLWDNLERFSYFSSRILNRLLIERFTVNLSIYAENIALLKEKFPDRNIDEIFATSEKMEQFFDSLIKDYSNIQYPEFKPSLEQLNIFLELFSYALERTHVQFESGYKTFIKFEKILDDMDSILTQEATDSVIKCAMSKQMPIPILIPNDKLFNPKPNSKILTIVNVERP